MSQPHHSPVQGDPDKDATTYMTLAIASLFLPGIGLALALGAISGATRILRYVPEVARAHTTVKLGVLSMFLQIVYVVAIVGIAVS